MLNGKPVICITSDTNALSFEKDGKSRQIQAVVTYGEAIFNAGGIPIIAYEQCPEELAELCDGLVLSGGADVDPDLYGEEVFNDTVKCDPIRTAFEVPLIRAFMAKGKPILGICRGSQILNCYLGGTMWQDLLAQKGWIHMHGEMRHDIYTEPGSVLRQLFGPVVKSNSTHHQAVKDLAPGLRVTARSIEGIIEGYEHETLPILATQFHPERLTGRTWDDRTPDYAPWFRHFVELVEKNAAK